MFKNSLKIKNLKLKISKGFTLLEMLVVIGLIGVILSLGATSYSTAQKKARDSKRKSDLRTIQGSLEQYYAVCSYNYPTPQQLPTGVVSSIICLSPSTALMPTVPTDPKSGVYYKMTGDGSSYSICVPIPTGGTKPLETETVTSYCLSSQQ